MSVYESQVVAFARYATAQVEYHQQVLALHQVDGTGCCRLCGRVWPCDEVLHSRQMANHFSQWALDDHAEQLPQAEQLVRPYVHLSPDAAASGLFRSGSDPRR